VTDSSANECATTYFGAVPPFFTFGYFSTSRIRLQPATARLENGQTRPSVAQYAMTRDLPNSVRLGNDQVRATRCGRLRSFQNQAMTRKSSQKVHPHIHTSQKASRFRSAILHRPGIQTQSSLSSQYLSLLTTMSQ
jgi:hypothetical protein